MLNRAIRVGLTEAHGMAQDMIDTPPRGVQYSIMSHRRETPTWMSSPIKGFLRAYESADHDIIETVLSPIRTSNRWICRLACFQEALAFALGPVPLPRVARRIAIERLLVRSNMKQLVFWSRAGLDTLKSYGGVTDPRIVDKATFVYPSVRRIPDELIQYRTSVRTILFSGQFFRKGGVNVVDAFARLYREHPECELLLCCRTPEEFETPNDSLKQEYLRIVTTHPGIRVLGRVPRQRMLEEILPRADIYLLPTYVDTFGFAVLEAMAYGIPVVATNYFAIPEMIEHDRSGFLINVSNWPLDKIYRGQVIRDISPGFREFVTEALYGYLKTLVGDAQLRETMGRAGLARARSIFSVERRSEHMLRIYESALQ